MTNPAVHVSPMANTEAPTATPLSPKGASFGVRHRRGFITAAVVGFLLALVGAMETGQIGFLPRILYWEILMLSGATIGLGVSEMVEKWGRLRSRKWLEMPFVATLIALPLTMMVVGTSNVFFNTRPPPVSGLIFMFGITFAVSLAMTMLNYLMHWPGTGLPDTAPAPAQSDDLNDNDHAADTQANRFAERLPLPLRGQHIFALEAEDHYLRVHFGDGQSTLILMRLSDAISELPTDMGAQTHRSWWVAKNAVQKVTRADGRATLVLTGDLEVPVSRSHYKALGAAGWFN